MSGKYSRRRGHEFEVECANRLSEHTGLDIVTTRSLGATYGADLCTVTAYDNHGRPVTHIPSVLGFSIECKAVVQRCPKQWLRQATNQAAPGTTPVVLWSRKHYAWGKGSAFISDPDAPRGWRETPISEWLEELNDVETEAA